MTTKIIKTLITHDGSFHADDIFACATLCLVLEKESKRFEIIRTRDEEAIKNGDYVFDVGGVYDANTNRFDHHQKGGAGKRENGIEYASFGLVWKKYGLEVSSSLSVAEIIDERLVSSVDADDNGVELFEKKPSVPPFLIQDFFKFMCPTWKENQQDFDASFLKTVNIAKEVIVRSIIHVRDAIEAEQKIIQAYQNAKNKKIIILDRYYPLSKVFENFPESLFVIFPRNNSTLWSVRAVSKTGKEFENRKDLPKSWAGLCDDELAKISGVPDAFFCHRNLFIATAKSKEGAIKLAQIAIES